MRRQRQIKLTRARCGADIRSSCAIENSSGEGEIVHEGVGEKYGYGIVLLVGPVNADRMANLIGLLVHEFGSFVKRG